MEMVRILAVFGGVRKSKHNVVELHTAHSNSPFSKSVLAHIHGTLVFQKIK